MRKIDLLLKAVNNCVILSIFMKFSIPSVFTKSKGYVRLSERCFTWLSYTNLKIIHIETRWSEKEKHYKPMS